MFIPGITLPAKTAFAMLLAAGAAVASPSPGVKNEPKVPEIADSNTQKEFASRTGANGIVTGSVLKSMGRLVDKPGHIQTQASKTLAHRPQANGGAGCYEADDDSPPAVGNVSVLGGQPDNADGLFPQSLFYGDRKISTGLGFVRSGGGRVETSTGIPGEFEHGTANGKLYFVRLKYGKDRRAEYNAGIARLMAYIDDKNIMRVERKNRVMTTDELKATYMKRGTQPTFLYLYVDSDFSLSGAEVDILREYVAKGGFLFIDGRPDELDKTVVRRELGKVFPGRRLAAIPNGHVINRFIFKLPSPAFGTNILDRKNYGISAGNRLIAFYTPGNFANFYESFNPNDDEYVAAQFQMGVNVIFYANTKGAQTFSTRQGASAKLSESTLEKIGLVPRAPSPGMKYKAAQPTVKVHGTPEPLAPGASEPERVPDDIRIFGQ